MQARPRLPGVARGIPHPPDDGLSMKQRTTFPLAIICLAAALAASDSLHAQSGDSADVSDDSLKAASERMRQTSQQMQKDIQERLDKLRLERAALQARQAAERRQESEQAARQAEKDRAALAAIKEAKQREALAAAQAQARQEATARAAEAERLRQAALKAKEEEEAALERAQRESLDTYKAGTRQNRLGTQTQFGVDL